MRLWAGGLVIVLGVCAAGAQELPEFAVASIRPSSGQVQFEHDGTTEVAADGVRMHDVSVLTCVEWAYGVQRGQIQGPGWMDSEKFDILAKNEEKVPLDELKRMMQGLLAERFQLKFHREKKEMRAYVMKVVKPSARLRQASAEETPLRQNGVMGSTVRALTMQEFGDFLSGPLEAPVVDGTRLAGRWDFSFDFTTYLPKTEPGVRPDFVGVLNATLQGEVGLKLDSQRTLVEVLVVDKVERPTAN